MSPSNRYLTSGIRISLSFSRYDPSVRRYIPMGRTRRVAVTSERDAERFLRHVERACNEWDETAK